jgi:hypothetical protein
MTITAQERRTIPKPLDPVTKPDEGDGPTKPDVRRPGGGPDELLKRLRKIDPDQAKRYRQRSGQ